MKKQNRNYTDEFKLQAVNLAAELGSVLKASKQLGIPEVNVYVWRKKLGTQTSLSPVDLDSTTAEMIRENQRLQQENSHLKKVNHILKSAAAFFSQDHLK